MVKSKKIVSFAVVLAMLLTMLSSMIVVNAADTATVYTKVTDGETEGTVSIEVGYKNVPAEFQSVGSVSVQIQMPEGYTVAKNSDIKYSEIFDGEADNDWGGIKTVNGTGLVTISRNQSGFNYTIPAEGVIAKIMATKAEDATGEATFEIKDIDFDDGNGNHLKLSDSTAVAENGTYGKASGEPVVVAGPAVYIEDVNPDNDGTATITVSYREIPDEFLSVGSVSVQIQVPEGFKVEKNSDIKYSSTFDGEADNDWGGIKTVNGTGLVTISRNQSGFNYTIPAAGDIATIKVTAPDGFTGSAEFKITDIDFDDGNGNHLKLSDSTISAVNGKVTTEDLNPVEDEVTIAIDPETATAKAGETVDFTVTVDGADDTTFSTSTGTINGTKVTVTVPEDAKEGDKITVTVKATADETKTASAVITVAASGTTDETDYTIPAQKETIKTAGGNVEVLAPKINLDADTITALKATINDAETYRVIFDFKNSKKTVVGWALVNVTGEQLKNILDGKDTVTAGATNASPDTTEIHFEDSKGNIVTPAAK